MFWLLFIFLICSVIILKIFFEIFSEKTPFIPTPKKTLLKILKEIEIEPNKKFYDLGCGDGRVIFLFYKKQPRAFYYGIEKKFFPYLLAKIKLFFLKIKDKKISQKINFLFKDIFKTDLSSIDYLYLYLTPNLLEKIEPKLLKELKKGTKIISCDFPLKNFSLIKEINLNNKKLGKRVFIYQK